MRLDNDYYDLSENTILKMQMIYICSSGIEVISYNKKVSNNKSILLSVMTVIIVLGF